MQNHAKPCASQASQPVSADDMASAAMVVAPVSLVKEAAVAATFALPEKPLRSTGALVLAADAVLAAVDSGVGAPGRQGAWAPGRGRPPKALKGLACRRVQRKAGGVPLRIDLLPEQKKRYCDKLKETFDTTGCSRAAAFQEMAGQLGCTWRTVRKMWDGREIWQNLSERQLRRGKIGHNTGKKWGKPGSLSLICSD